MRPKWFEIVFNVSDVPLELKKKQSLALNLLKDDESTV